MNHQNLPLAREFCGNFIETECSSSLSAELAAIVALLDGGDECELLPLPGDTLSGIIANLQTALQLCSVPAPMPTTGRNRADKQWQARFHQQALALHIRVCLALLGAGSETGAAQ